MEPGANISDEEMPPA